MASIQRHGAKWRVQLYANGKRESRVFPSKARAAAWALEREAELTGAALPDRSLGDAMDRYAREVSPGHRGERWEVVRLAALGRHPIAQRRLSVLSASDLTAWRDGRLRTCKPGTVAREMTLLRCVLECCRREWGWIRSNPLDDVRRPTLPAGRARRVSQAEIDAVVSAFGVADLSAETATQRTGLAFLLSIETAMRSGEMLGLQWRDVDLAARVVTLPRTKNGTVRQVPLSTRAVEILRALASDNESVFRVTDRVRDALWRKTLPAELRAADLHFHDARSEAIWRLSRRLDVLDLARVIGHRDINSLMHYYRASAADLAARLD